jgi:hypothetical protein
MFELRIFRPGGWGRKLQAVSELPGVTWDLWLAALAWYQDCRPLVCDAVWFGRKCQLLEEPAACTFTQF